MAKHYAYYNEIDDYAAQWLRNLISAGLIAPGLVDQRSIEDVRPSDLTDFTQCHFFAGIGVWSHALRLAGIPDFAPVWTGSCPCQPFSQAGKGDGFADERHLWPHFHWLIQQRRPPVVYGEQVASDDGLTWLDLVQADMEASGYSVGASDLCAAGFGAPHIRQRLYWVAHANEDRLGTPRGVESGHGERDLEPRGTASWLGDPYDPGLEGHGWRYPASQGRLGTIRPTTEASKLGGVADAAGSGCESGSGLIGVPAGEGFHLALPQPGVEGDNGRPSETNGFWRAADWLLCRDERWRAVEPRTFPLADRSAAHVGRLRAYGNAIVSPVAQGFIQATWEFRP